MTLSFHHVALTVANAERSIQFYEKFGFQVVQTPAGSKHGIYRLKHGSVILELFVDAEATGKVTDEFAGDLKQIGPNHFGFATEDLSQAVADLKKKGIELASEIKEGRTVSKYCFFRDPDGNWVEILQQ